MKKDNIKVLDNVESFESNIAKYSIVETIKEMKGEGFELKIFEFDKQ